MVSETFTASPGDVATRDARFPYAGLRGGIYARKSAYRGAKANRGRSVREQLDAGHADANRHRINVVGEYIDDGRSASRHGADVERDDFERLLRDVEGDALDIVIAWASTRLQRDLAVYVRLRDTCWVNGVLWCYGGKVYDLSNKDDRFRTGLDALLGEREVDEMRDNVLRSLRANAASGKPHGLSPYGYQRVYDTYTRAFVCVAINFEQAEVVREICRRVANGETYLGIARDLNEREVPVPALRWTNDLARD
ncbi:recombinase family protein [Streptomyces noursei]|uniref:recombinase family protein n=1 Tax=Streptomyces noursei TaxID=1971 RepID=UPI0033DB055A